nr:hypothetical protein Iba_chr12cCG11520 [Ipomoea batatas]
MEQPPERETFALMRGAAGVWVSIGVDKPGKSNEKSLFGLPPEVSRILLCPYWRTIAPPLLNPSREFVLHRQIVSKKSNEKYANCRTHHCLYLVDWSFYLVDWSLSPNCVPSPSMLMPLKIDSIVTRLGTTHVDICSCRTLTVGVCYSIVDADESFPLPSFKSS